MTPLTWRQFGNAPTVVDPLNNASLNPNGSGVTPPWCTTSGGVTNFTTIAGMIEAWCSAVYHETSGRIRLFGGGHNDYAGNQLLTLNVFDSSPAWELETPPTGAIGQVGTGAFPCDDGNESSNVYFDKLPRSIHSYDLLVARGDEFWLIQPGAPFKSAGSGTGTNLALPGIFKWNGKTWINIAQGAAAIGPSGGGSGSSPIAACYDESRDRIYVLGNGSTPIRYWDCAAGVKADTTVFTNVSGGTTRCIRIPELDVIVVLDVAHTGHIGVYDYGRTAGASIHQPTATGSVPTSPTYSTPFFYSNGVWVPGYGGGVGAILCWHGGTSFRVLTPPAVGNVATTAWAWSALNADGSNVIDPGNPNSTGVWGRLFYSKRLGGIGLVKSATAQPYFFALE